ncbi:probable inactive ATP-dependent zinc metalloprotease FTSHI 5, chloroplastic isoform X1 [Coffea arabica]|uniref:Probable inactive ATP-dependent zinc metalloprotease FTSHI 5, chloroplastic isoform X1 n=1 Tax=Coffea arabica TaxID=13443 RepID=A0A6P6V1W1_COFAR|nr:probable inactive ATP-dependent zinc metalloprotease FTSHI 5, chloroplastic [Coffea arabica]
MFGILIPQTQTPLHFSPPHCNTTHILCRHSPRPRRRFKRNKTGEFFLNNKPPTTFSSFPIPFFTTATSAAAIATANSSAAAASSCLPYHKDDDDSKDDDNAVPLPLPKSDASKNKKPLLSSALFWLLVAVFTSSSSFRILGSPHAAAMAAVVTTTEVTRKKTNPTAATNTEQQDIRRDKPRHQYSHSTQRLLDIVSQRLLRKMEDVKNGKDTVHSVEEALKDVKFKKKELQDEIMSGLYADLRVFRAEKAVLLKRSEDILDAVLKAKREEEILSRSSSNNNRAGDLAVAVKDKIVKLEEEMRNGETQYNEMWDRVAEIDDQILRRETVALSIGVRELSFIERECEQLVQGFLRDMRRTNVESVQNNSVTKLSISEIKDQLQSAHRQFFEQIALRNVSVGEDHDYEDNAESLAFAQRIKHALSASKDMQKNLEDHLRKRMKKYGDDKRFVVSTPVDEVVKGFPEFELKWMFGSKEVVVPKSVGLHLFHGWKRWREEVKANFKRDLLENVELRKKYVAERQEKILLDRDRVMSRTWYNEERNMWEMDPIAVPYAVSKKLIQSARIRHDWAAMYITLKGDEREYYVDVKEFEMLFEDFGGFDGLYLRMLAYGVPTVVQLMWIPFSELDFGQQFLLVMRLCHQCLTGLWNTTVVSRARGWIIDKIRNINDDLMMMIVFPTVEFIIPYSIRMRLGMAWPEYVDQSVGSTWYLKWQSEAEMNFRSRKTDGLQWYLWFLLRSVIYGFVLLHVFRFMRRKIPGLLGYGPLRRDPNLRKLQRVKYYFKSRLRSIKQKKRDGVDPISTAFDQMKRVKNPPIRLKDFASVDSMREEINEVVAFLQNPRAFQDMGARAPRGVLIVGERGTGKTSLALAIAAEAKVPVVEVKAQQLEAGLWVGQSASNVRELFQTARDLAPVIIFVEDFDLFAGVRGKFIHTKKQDHEAFINQLLVELDGFEKQDGVVLMATTRNLKQIDEALQRPGRMDRIFHLQRPTQRERERILHIAAKETMDEELIDLVDWRKVAEKTALLRPIELKLVPMALESSAFRSKFLDTDELLSYCSWLATFSGFVPNWVRKTKTVGKLAKILVNHLGLTLTKEDLQNVADLMEPYGQISNGIELLNPPYEWTRETKLPHAVWAAGRGLLAFLLPNFDVIDNLWLEPFSWEGIGCTKITKARSEGSLNGNVESRAYLEKKLVFCFGSYIASQLLLPFGEENMLSSSELKKAQEIATRMVIQYGWGPDDSPMIYHHGNAVTALSMGNNYEYEMAAKVEKIYYLAYDKAKSVLQKNRKVMEKIVEELLEYEILTGKDLERIFEDNGGIREEEPFSLSSASGEEPIFKSLHENGNALGSSLLTTSS